MGVEFAIATVSELAWTRGHRRTEIHDGADVADRSARSAPVGRIIRRERPPGEQLSLLVEADGWRDQAFATNTRVGQLGFLEARPHAHARVEDRIKRAKDTGLGRFSSRGYPINQA